MCTKVEGRLVVLQLSQRKPEWVVPRWRKHCGRQRDYLVALAPSRILVSSMLGAYRDTVAAPRWNSTGGIPQVKCRHLADRSCTSGAIRRIDHALVVPPGGQVTN